MTVFAGDPTYASDLNNLPKGTLAKHIRTSVVTGVAGTETGVQRIDAIPVRNGYTYKVVCPRVNITVSSATTPSSVGLAKLRGSTSGAATIASAILAGYREGQSDASQTDTGTLIGYFEATANGTLSVIQTIIRASGTATVGVYGSATEPNSMYVEEVGLTVTDTGVDL